MSKEYTVRINYKNDRYETRWRKKDEVETKLVEKIDRDMNPSDRRMKDKAKYSKRKAKKC